MVRSQTPSVERVEKAEQTSKGSSATKSRPKPHGQASMLSLYSIQLILLSFWSKYRSGSFIWCKSKYSIMLQLLTCALSSVSIVVFLTLTVVSVLNVASEWAVVRVVSRTNCFGVTGCVLVAVSGLTRVWKQGVFLSEYGRSTKVTDNGVRKIEKDLGK